MIDLHIHTKFSPDGHSEMEEYIKRAIELNMPAIGFSEHVDYDYLHSPLEMDTTDYEAFTKRFFELKEKYKGKIKLLFGAETGYSIPAENDIKEFLERYPFDYDIISTHIVYDEDPWLQPYFIGKTPHEAYTRYLECVLDAVKSPLNYQTVAHFGYVLRQAPYKERELDFATYGDYLDEILSTIVKKDKALELNTKTGGLGAFQPDLNIVKRYIELGGKNFTFGSDAHEATRLAENYKVVADTLKSLGIKYILHFENRKPVYDKL